MEKALKEIKEENENDEQIVCCAKDYNEIYGGPRSFWETKVNGIFHFY